ncbi:hypothetical protein QQ045_023033 [Rhodiola kirilowii]
MAMYVLRRETRRRFPQVMSPAPMVAVRSTLIPNSNDQEQDEECENYSENYQGNEDGCSFKDICYKLLVQSRVSRFSIYMLIVKTSTCQYIMYSLISFLSHIRSGPEKETKYIILGEKAKAQLIRDSKKDIEIIITELQKNPLNYTHPATQVSVLADDILKNVEFDALRIVYNKFQSVVTFIPTMATVLSPEVAENEAQAEGKLALLDSYELEDEAYKSEILPNLIEFQFSCVLFNAVLENACSEQGARMSAMDSSSRNAGEMLDRLALSYNRTRQASITTELTEIISGASALGG